jgi:hypothetical protein
VKDFRLRGSRRRIRRTRFRENWPRDMWIFLGLVILLMAVLLPWLARQPLRH